MLYLSGGKLHGMDQHRAARLYLSALYQKAWNAPMPELLKKPSGQPCFPVPGRFCSLTHTSQAAFCALSDAPIGLDAEPETRAVSPRLAGKILSPEELSQYESAEDPRLCLLTFWVLKEAYVKYTGEGLPGVTKALPFELSGPRPRLSVSPDVGLHFTLLRSCGHLLAVCSPRPDPPAFWDGIACSP